MESRFLSNGVSIPSIGLGTWQASGKAVTKAVNVAIDAGYRHIDCAYVYGNEAEVGQALQRQIIDNCVLRRDLFVTSKLWCTFHQKAKVRENIITTLSSLNLEYLDLYLIHWPVSMKPSSGMFPCLPNGDPEYDNTQLEETWEAMEQLVQAGLVRSIGLSNFNKAQIQRVLECSTILPSVLQVESHPYFLNNKIIEFARGAGMSVTAYAPLGSSYHSSHGDNQHLTDHPVIRDISTTHQKSPAQILIRHALQRDLVVIPKSVTPDRIIENIHVFDFELGEDEMERINGLDKNQRLINPPRMGNHPEYPFKDPY